MSSLIKQRDLLVTQKKEISANISILSKVLPLPGELSRHIFKEDALEKPTQNFFINLTYYLVLVIDPQKALLFSWPLYDTKSEKTYRTQLATFLTEFYKTGAISPVMSSYFVNPGCYKIVKLLSQMSRLAVHRALLQKMNKEPQKLLLQEATERYYNGSNNFVEFIEKETQIMMNKFTKFLHKRTIMESIAEKLRNQITRNETKLQEIHKRGLVNNLVDKFLEQNEMNEEQKNSIEKIKNFLQPAPIFEESLVNLDRTLANLKSKWESKMSTFMGASKVCQETAQALILRHTGEMDKRMYVVEYNHKTDEISTKDLENQVNSQQKYILKNIVKEEKLIFPNLIRGYVISVCYVMKNADMGDIRDVNEFLECRQSDFAEITDAFKALLERIHIAENKLQPSPLLHHTISLKGFEIPAMPDLSGLLSSREHPSFITDSFTPLGTSKHQFNLNRRTTTTFKAQPKSLITPFHPPRDDYMKTLVSCRATSYSKTKSSLNISAIPHVGRANETIAGTSTGFTKEQIQRLLSTKKTSSSKKHKFNNERPRKVKKASLFNETTDHSIMFRSHSSPNLYEKKEKRSLERYMTSMADYPLLEVSGIAALEPNSTCVTPQEAPIPPPLTPVITIDVSPVERLETFSNILKETEDLNHNFNETMQPTSTNEAKTPTNVQPVKKTNSIEKIINRFKKVRSIVVTSPEDIRTIVEEKENMNELNIDVFAVNKVLLPDLLSPSCSVLSKKVDHYDPILFDDDDDDKKNRRRPRESLGVALGVDETFLDQFDLID